MIDWLTQLNSTTNPTSQRSHYIYYYTLLTRCLYKYTQCFSILFMFVFITVLHALSISTVCTFVTCDIKYQSINQSLHPFNGLFSRTTWLSRHQKGKTSLDLNKARNDGVLGCSGIRWTMCKQSAPRFRQITTPTPHHLIFTGRMLYLTPDQQSQSTEGSSIIVTQYLLQVVNLRLLHPALAEYCDEHVCLSVCPFARISLKPYVQTSPNFVCVCVCVTYGHDSILLH